MDKYNIFKLSDRITAALQYVSNGRGMAESYDYQIKKPVQYAVYKYGVLWEVIISQNDKNEIYLHIANKTYLEGVPVYAFINSQESITHDFEKALQLQGINTGGIDTRSYMYGHSIITIQP